jgi:ankyrin repeat protein
MAISLSLTLSDLDSVPTLLESIRLRCQSSSESKWLLWAEEWASKATQTLEQLAVHYEDEENVKETYKEPGVFRSLRLLETHLELLMGTEDLQKLFITTIYNLLHPGMVDLNSEMVKFNYEMLELLLPMVDPSADGNYAIRLASGYNCVAIIELLLAARDDSGRLCVDPSANDNDAIRFAFRFASQFGHVAVVKLLLAARDDSGRLCVDPSANDNEAIRAASQNGHEAVVKLLLAARDDSGRLCVDPAALNNKAIRFASQNGYEAVVASLLAAHDDSGRLRVDPSALENYAIRWASYHGNLAVVNRLLQDERVDPSADNNFAIRFASKNGHLAIVKRLLQDPRVDPSAFNNYAIRSALENGHKEIVDLLKPRCKLNFFQKLWY